MPLPIFAIGTAIVRGAKAVGKSPIFQNALSAAKTAAGNTLSGSTTNVVTTGSTNPMLRLVKSAVATICY